MESSSIDSGQLAPDVAVALELLRRVDVEGWGELTAGLFHSTPFIYIEDAERLDALQAWLSTRAGDESSYVQAAVANFKRVLEDLILVLNHLMEVRGGQYWVVRWYHATHGRPGHQRDVAQYQAHVILVQNLGAELTRALNLIVARVRAADAAAIGGMGVAVIAAGPDHRRIEVPSYSQTEARVPQPYPGLRAFPATLPNRVDGSFGVGQADEAPSVAAIEEWISTIERENGPGNGPPPPTDSLPFSLDRPVTPPADPGQPHVPMSVFVGLGALSAISSMIAVLNEEGWVIGAVLMGVGTFALLRHYAWPPNVRGWAVGLIAVASAVGGVTGYVISDALENEESVRRSPRALSVGSGQLAQGDFFRARPRGTKRYDDPVNLKQGSLAEAKLRLSNLGPDSLTQVRVRAQLPDLAARAGSVEAIVAADHAHPSSVSDTVAVQFGSKVGCLRVVAGSARLLDANGAPLHSLPGTLDESGVVIGRLDVGHDKRRFVSFLVEVVEPGDPRAHCQEGART